MPIYEYQDKNTGEVISKMIKLADVDQFKADNPHLERYYSRAPLTISGTKSAMQMAGTEWNDHMKRIKSGSGKENSIDT